MEKKIYNYAKSLDNETLRQFKSCFSEPFVISAALMPDAHSGYVAPIGSVLITKSVIVPAWVGYDIGCGLIAVKLKGKNLVEKVRKNPDKIYEKVKEKVPMGLGELNAPEKITEKTKKEFEKLLNKFTKGAYDKNIYQYLKSTALRHLGTLGGGNHFIELCFSKKELWLIIHSGSRGIGHRVAQKYMIKASGSKDKYEKTFPLKDSSELGKEYINILSFGLEYALLNRLEMSYKVLEALKETLKVPIKAELWTNKNHNHALYEHGSYIHRKGATPAKKGERGVIPGNMRDGSFLVEGKGSSKFLNSSSHGAGRAMSRKQARQEIPLSEFKENMKGITGTISEKTLDEAPRAYKDLFEVMALQKPSVKIIKHLSPLINWKG